MKEDTAGRKVLGNMIISWYRIGRKYIILRELGKLQVLLTALFIPNIDCLSPYACSPALYIEWEHTRYKTFFISKEESICQPNFVKVLVYNYCMWKKKIYFEVRNKICIHSLELKVFCKYEPKSQDFMLTQSRQNYNRSFYSNVLQRTVCFVRLWSDTLWITNFWEDTFLIFYYCIDNMQGGLYSVS